MNVLHKFLITQEIKVIIYKKNLLKSLLERSGFNISIKRYSELTPPSGGVNSGYLLLRKK